MIDGKIDNIMYLNIFKQNLKQSAQTMCISSSFKRYQENVRKHNAYIFADSGLCITIQPQVIGRPAQSPNLNPIENILDHLETRIH